MGQVDEARLEAQLPFGVPARGDIFLDRDEVRDSPVFIQNR